MQGIASFLDRSAEKTVRDLWQELESQCGLTGVKSTLFPHFTWQVTEGYDMKRLELAIRRICHSAAPFTVRTVGIGIFSGEKPVVYLPIFKDTALLKFHERLWKITRDIAFEPWPFYTPEQWVPHITLAYNDVTPANLDCAVRTLAFREFPLEIWIDNLTYFSQGEGQTESNTYRFGV